MTTKLP